MFLTTFSRDAYVIIITATPLAINYSAKSTRPNFDSQCPKTAFLDSHFRSPVITLFSSRLSGPSRGSRHFHLGRWRAEWPQEVYYTFVQMASTGPIGFFLTSNLCPLNSSPL